MIVTLALSDMLSLPLDAPDERHAMSAPDRDRLLWEALYRALLMVAEAIKKAKLS